MNDVLHPGPAPEPYVFPFVEAQAALGAIDDLADDLSRTVDRHDDAAATATVGFHGRAADEFAQLLRATLDALAADVRTLRRHADVLEQELAVARRRRDASTRARSLWARQLAAWRAQGDAG